MINGHPDSRHSSGHDFLSGIVLGMVFGAAAGVLLAPKAGSDTRETVAHSARRMRERARHTYEEASHTVHDAVDRGREAWRAGRETFDRARASHQANHIGDEPPMPV